MPPSELLARHRQAIRDIVSAHHAAAPRLFGSVLHGEDREGSDVDLLVDPLPGTTLLDLGAIQTALEDLLGVPVDVLTPGDLPATFRQQVMDEARPL